MAKTRDEVVTLAHRLLGVVAADEVMTADQMTFGGDILVGIVGELEAVQGLSPAWDADSVPDGLYLPVAYLLAADLAPHYLVAPPYPRSQMIGKVRAYELPDDRATRADLDNNGTVTTEETEADARAVFY